MINQLVFLITSVFFLFLTYTYLNALERYHLKKYGKVTDVRIENKSKSIKGIDITTVKYDGIEKQLFLNNYEIGETQKIIFSRQNPKIACWLDEYRQDSL